MDRQTAEDHGNLLARHLEYMVNYELHLRKTFWVEESLSYMLGQTTLDLAGRMLKLPLVHLVINAILYTTSADVASEPRTSPLRTREQWAVHGAGDAAYLSSRDVIFLPGKIDISHVKQLQAVEKSSTGRGLMVKFMVRGHWRRASLCIQS